MPEDNKISPELQTALDKLSTDLEGKSKTEAKTLIDAFAEEYEGKFNKKLTDEIKAASDLLETDLKAEFKTQIDAVQEHADKLDVKLQERPLQISEPKDELKQLITDNFDEIKTVRKGKGVSIETKAVANMTLSTALTGDEPRTYSNIVAAVPGQLLNVGDLCASINISGGTFTYPLESGGEGTITTQTEGSDKAQVDYDFTMTDVTTDFIAGFVVFSKKMVNNLPFLESFIPQALRRDYWISENTIFDAVLAAAATASSQVITSQNKVEMIVQEIATLEGANEAPNGIVVTPADFWDIMITEKSTGAGYGLPGFVTFDGGQLRINGIPVFKANWVDTNKYYVGNWNEVKKIVTMGLSVEFSEHDEDNFRKNNISARVEAQVGIALLRAAALIYGDFTAT